jgi:hypothetical protein
MLICTLSIKDSEKTFFWTSRFERDADEKITGFTDQLQCQPMEGSGRFAQVWKLERWMGPHVAVICDPSWWVVLNMPPPTDTVPQSGGFLAVRASASLPCILNLNAGNNMAHSPSC